MVSYGSTDFENFKGSDVSRSKFPFYAEPLNTSGRRYSKIYVTPGFKNKTECIAICMPGSSSIHIVTSSVNNQQQYHEKRIKRL
jgi:hypothetical protein